MENKLKELLNKYISGQLSAHFDHAGGAVEPAIVLGQDVSESKVLAQKIVASRLPGFWTFNDRVLAVIMSVLVAFVFFLGILIWKYNTNATMVLALIAGETGGIYFGINKMHQLYKESLSSRMLYELLQTANTEGEKDKIIESIKDILNA